MIGRLFCIAILLFASYVNAQNTPTFFAFTEATNRAKTSVELVNLVDATIAIPLTDSNYKKWKSAFWAMEIMLYKPTIFEANIPIYLNQFKQLSAELQWAFLEALYTLYPGNYAKQVENILQESKTAKIKSLILEYLILKQICPKIDSKDPFRKSPYYQLYLSNIQKISSTTPIKEAALLNTNFLNNQTVLVSFQFKDRNMPGYLMIRNQVGNWVLDSTNTPFRFKQLARSITNMPYYLTNGNTPQGLYKITGLDTSNNNWIGPTTNLQMVMPYEHTEGIQFFSSSNELTNKHFYQSLLGPLASIEGLWQSYEAGKIGRSEIIAHGTTIPTQFYLKQPYFPCTPSLGCLCSPEVWNEHGMLVSSVQADWMAVVKKLTQFPNYILVVEL